MCSAVSANPPVVYAQPPLTTTVDDPPPAPTTVLDTCPATEKEFFAGKDNCKDGLKCRFTTKHYVVSLTVQMLMLKVLLVRTPMESFVRSSLLFLISLQ